MVRPSLSFTFLLLSASSGSRVIAPPQAPVGFSLFLFGVFHSLTSLLSLIPNLACAFSSLRRQSIAPAQFITRFPPSTPKKLATTKLKSLPKGGTSRRPFVFWSRIFCRFFTGKSVAQHLKSWESGRDLPHFQFRKYYLKSNIGTS